MTGRQFKMLETFFDLVTIENDDNLYEVLDKDRMGRIKMRKVMNTARRDPIGSPFWMDYRDVELC